MLAYALLELNEIQTDIFIFFQLLPQRLIQADKGVESRVG